MEEFYGKIAEILEMDEVKPTDVLADFPEWDSLSVLSTIAMIGSDYGLTLSADDLRGVATVGELRELVAAKRAM